MGRQCGCNDFGKETGPVADRKRHIDCGGGAVLVDQIALRVWGSETVDLSPVIRCGASRGVEIDSHQRREIVIDDVHGQIVD